MINESVVKFGLNYLEECQRGEKQATLVRMLEYIDYFERLVANADEINAILERSPGLFVVRSDGLISFSLQGTERSISDDDATQAISAYRADFQRRYEELLAKKKLQ